MPRKKLEDMLNATAEDWAKIPPDPDGRRMVSVSGPLEGDLLSAAHAALHHGVGLKARTKEAKLSMHENVSEQDK